MTRPALFGVLALAVLGGAVALHAQTPPGPVPREAATWQTVSVTGTGRVSLTPDRASFTVGVQTVAPSSLAEGIFVGAPFSAQDPRPEVRAFVVAYTRKYGTTPDGNAALAYDATKLLAHAVERVGPDRFKIRDYLATLSGGDAYRGVTGSIRFRIDGDPVGKSMVMTRVRNGELLVEAAK